MMRLFSSVPSIAAPPAVKDAFFVKRPLLKKIVDKYSSYRLSDYAFHLITEGLVKPDLQRSREFISVMNKLLLQRFDPILVEEVCAQFQEYYFASTADHIGPLAPADVLSAHLIVASAYKKIADPLLKYIIVFPCASISLSHEDFPRGIFFHSYHDNAFQLQKLSFLPSNSHSSTTYNFRPYTLLEVIKVKKLLIEKVKNGLVSQYHADIIMTIFDNIYSQKDILQSSNYCCQISKSNFHLWKYIFTPASLHPPDYICIEQEELVRQLLLDYHINSDTLLHRMIFNENYCHLLIDPLTQAMTPFLRQGVTPTHLFWCISADKHTRIPLYKQGQTLVAKDENIHFALEPDVISEALERKILIPDLLLIFTVLVLYYQVNCFGGGGQMEYLTAMQKVYNDLHLDSSPSRANTQLFTYSLQGLFLNDGNEAPFATGLDLLLYEKYDRWLKIKRGLDSLTFAQIFEMSLQDICSTVC